MHIVIPRPVREIANIFKTRGFSCYAVGGAVRDSLLGKEPDDWDLATDAKPEEVAGMFPNIIPTGIQHGTVTIRWKGHSYETTTFRIESAYSDSRHPDSVEYTTSLEADLSRRDFTINSMAADPQSGEVLDYFGGKGDLRQKLVRAVGKPAERFREDVLRTLRAVRFAGILAFEIEEETKSAIGISLGGFEKISAERIREEFSRILHAPVPSYPLDLLAETGLMEKILPELLLCRGVGQGRAHRFDVYRHLLASCDAAPPVLEIRLSALFHDLGKPNCRAEQDGVLSFYGHEALSARIAREIMARLKYPNAVTELVALLVENHMVAYDLSWTDGAVRRFIRRIGTESLEYFFALKAADAAGMSGTRPEFGTVKEFYNRVKKILQAESALGLKDLAINGDDLIRLGFSRGPLLGKVLAELLEAVLDDPGLNTRQRLLDIAEALLKKYT